MRFNEIFTHIIKKFGRRHKMFCVTRQMLRELRKEDMFVGSGALFEEDKCIGCFLGVDITISDMNLSYLKGKNLFCEICKNDYDRLFLYKSFICINCLKKNYPGVWNKTVVNAI